MALKTTRWYITAAAAWFQQGHKDYYIHLGPDDPQERIQQNLKQMAMADGYIEWRIVKAALGNGIWILIY